MPYSPPAFVSEVLRITDRLRRLDRRCVAFGASAHRYSFGRPLDEDDLAAYERRSEIRLPPSYRAFLTAVGNGGAGPHYGVPALDTSASLASQPFPYAEPVPELPEADLEEPLTGCVPVADYGCGIELVLVVNGPQAGQVWWDARNDGQGVDRVVDGAGAPQSFDRWWLGYMERILHRFERVAELNLQRTPHEEIHRLLEPGTLQLDVDKTMASLMNQSLTGTPKVIPDKPWGMACGLADRHYTRWLKTLTGRPAGW